MSNKINQLKKDKAEVEFRLNQSFKMGFLMSATSLGYRNLSQMIDNLPQITTGDAKWLQEKLFDFDTLDDLKLWLQEAIFEVNALGTLGFNRYNHGKKPSFTWTSGDDATLIHYYQCDHCKSYLKTDDGDGNSYDGLWICPICYPEVNESAIRFVDSYKVGTNGWKYADHSRKFHKKYYHPVRVFFRGLMWKLRDLKNAHQNKGAFWR